MTKWKEAERVFYPDPRSGSEKGDLERHENPAWDEVERSGPTTDDLARVVYPDSRSRSEKGGLERQEEPYLVTKWKEADRRPYTGRLPRPAISEREGVSGTT